MSKKLPKGKISLEKESPENINFSDYKYIYKVNPDTKEIKLEKSIELPDGVMNVYSNLFESQGKRMVKPPWNTYELEWLLRYNSTHRRCMELKSILVAGFGYDIRNKEHANYKKLDEFLKRPNDIFGDTFSKITINTMRNKYSYGYGPLFINKALDKIQVFASTNAKSIFVIPNIRSGRKGIGIRKYIQVSKDGAISKEFFPYDGNPITGRNYIHMLGHKTFTSSYYPEPEYIAILDKIYEDIFVDKNNIDFFKNRAMGDFVILFSGARLSSKKKKQIQDVMDSNSDDFRGIGNQHKTMVLSSPDKDSAIKIVDLSKNEDGQYSQRQKSLENAIARAWGITPSLVLVAQGGSGFGGGSVSVGDLFLENQIMIRPEQRELEEDLNILLESLFDFNPEIKFRTIDTNNQKDMAIILSSIISSGAPIAKLDALKYIHEHGLMELTNPNVVPDDKDIIIPHKITKPNNDGDTRSEDNLDQKPDGVTAIDENKFNDNK